MRRRGSPGCFKPYFHPGPHNDEMLDGHVLQTQVICGNSVAGGQYVGSSTALATPVYSGQEVLISLLLLPAEMLKGIAEFLTWDINDHGRSGCGFVRFASCCIEMLEMLAPCAERLLIGPHQTGVAQRVLAPRAWSRRFLNLVVLTVVDIDEAASAHWSMLLTCFPLLEELTLSLDYATRNTHRATHGILHNRFVLDMIGRLKPGNLKLSRLCLHFGRQSRDWSIEHRLLPLMTPTAALWWLLEVCFTKEEHPAHIMRWMRMLAPDANLNWHPFSGGDNGEACLLHTLATQWPLKWWRGFQEAHDYLVECGADRLFVLTKAQANAGKSALGIFQARCETLAEE